MSQPTSSMAVPAPSAPIHGSLPSAPRRMLKAIWHFVTAPGLARRAGLLGIAVIVVAAICAPLLASYSPTALAGAPLTGPSAAHPLGTDQIGRDVLSRLLFGARTDLEIGFFGVTLSMLIGVPIGLLGGYFGGWLDTILGRIIDVFVAFPSLILVIAIVAMLGPGLRNFFIAIALVSWTSYARIIRAEVLSIGSREFVLAARALGYRDSRTMFRHILPNVMAPAFVFGMSDFVLDILAGASLGFFGLGVPAPTPEWGVMIADGRNFVLSDPWVVLFPGLAIILVGFFFSLLGDALADAVRRVDE